MFPPFNLAGGQRQARMFALQRLHSGQFIVIDHPFSLLGQLRGLLIQAVDVADLFIPVSLIQVWRQPITNLMGLDVPLFLKDVRRVGPKSIPQLSVSSRSFADS
jgi:hypothetical protein